MMELLTLTIQRPSRFLTEYMNILTGVFTQGTQGTQGTQQMQFQRISTVSNGG